MNQIPTNQRTNVTFGAARRCGEVAQLVSSSFKFKLKLKGDLHVFDRSLSLFTVGRLAPTTIPLAAFLHSS